MATEQEVRLTHNTVQNCDVDTQNVHHVSGSQRAPSIPDDCRGVEINLDDLVQAVHLVHAWQQKHELPIWTTVAAQPHSTQL